MFEARLKEASLLKKILEAIKDLVTDGNFDCSPTGIALQAMDSSHVALVALLMRSDGFSHYRCDRSMSLGINLTSMSKILKCAGNEDETTMKAEDSGDTVTFMFENNQQDRISDFELKLMDIDSETLGIPDQKYDATVLMPANEFQRICRDLTIIGDTVLITVSKEGVKFSVKGDLGSGNVMCKPSTSADGKEEESTIITLEDPAGVSLMFALRYLNFFTKATSLSGQVSLSLSKNVPLVVEYKIPDDAGYIRFYLAPKIDEE